MIYLHVLVSLILALLQLPLMLLAYPCLAVLLLTKWDGTSFYFGNTKYPRSKAATHYAAPTGGVYWKELLWYGWRNPVYNLKAHYLSIPMKAYTVKGNEDIGDKKRPGFYAIRMGWAWEYYWIYKYYAFKSWRCVRVRIGWKISNNTTPTAEQVFVPNPIMPYRGI